MFLQRIQPVFELPWFFELSGPSDPDIPITYQIQNEFAQSWAFMLSYPVERNIAWLKKISEDGWESEICVFWPERITRRMIIDLDNKLFIYGSLWIREQTVEEQMEHYDSAIKQCYALDDEPWVRCWAKFIPKSAEDLGKQHEAQKRVTEAFREWIDRALTHIFVEILYDNKIDDSS